MKRRSSSRSTNWRSRSLQVMANLKAILEAGGGSFGNVVKTTVLLADMGDFAAVNEIYGARSKPLSSACPSRASNRCLQTTVK